MANALRQFSAIVVNNFGDSSVLQLAQVDLRKPEKTEVLVRVHAFGINPVETYIRSGAHAFKPKLPYTPGHDAAGIVEEIGEGVSQWKVGDRVWTNNCITGSYGEYTYCHAENLAQLPENVSFEQGACLNVPYSTACLSMERTNAKPNETVLIHGGSGSVGLASIQFLSALGAKVIATAGSEEGIANCKAAGADFVVHHRKDGYVDEIKAYTNNKGVDVIFEMLANQNLQKDLELLGKGGRIAIIGSRGPIEILPRFLMSASGGIFGIQLGNSNEAERARYNAAIVAGLRKNFLSPVVGAIYSISDVSKAHDEIINTTSSKGNIVISLAKH